MRSSLTIAFLLGMSSPLLGDLTTRGFLGINSAATGLDGTGVVIGMVEQGRPGDPDKDLPANYHSQVNPAEVYNDTSIDGANSQFTQGLIGDHALEVAGVMIAKLLPDPSIVGISPEAQLHAGTYTSQDDVARAVASDRIARVPNIRVINVSVGRTPEGLDAPDATSIWSRFIDWSTEAQNVLYVVAGGEGLNAGIPEDNFNGISVGGSQRFNQGATGSFRQTWTGNESAFDPAGARVAIDILAPALNSTLANRGEFPDFQDTTTIESGTSYAAPHVTGTVALLQQFAETQADPPISNPGFISRNHREPEVMKAVILNSADKLQGVHGSRREVVRDDGTNWTTTAAHNSPFVPLSEELGAGHLNSNRALINLRPGEQNPGMVPRIGWDFENIGGGSFLDYTFDRQISGYVAVTLAWNRIVDKTGSATRYNTGDQFVNQSIDMELNNLNLYLMAANENNINNAIALSTATEDSVEHIFADVPNGNYKIRVQHADFLGDGQDFGLAWWAGEITAGDFDDDGDVDGGDLGLWQNNYGVDAGSLADADYDGDSDGADFLAWQRNFTGPGTLASATAVPESGSLLLLSLGLRLFIIRRSP